MENHRNEDQSKHLLTQLLTTQQELWKTIRWEIICVAFTWPLCSLQALLIGSCCLSRGMSCQPTDALCIDAVLAGCCTTSKRQHEALPAQPSGSDGTVCILIHSVTPFGTERRKTGKQCCALPDISSQRQPLGTPFSIPVSKGTTSGCATESKSEKKPFCWRI